jgi:hypothetical protein
MPSSQSRQQVATATRPKLPQQHGTKWLFMSLWLFRITNALLLETFFQPDEYFQCLEPAWISIFGSSSGAWLTWVRTNGALPNNHDYGLTIAQGMGAKPTVLNPSPLLLTVLHRGRKIRALAPGQPKDPR